MIAKPWWISQQEGFSAICSGSVLANADIVAEVEDHDLAKDIVRAVNAHDDLLEACKRCLAVLTLGMGDEVGSTSLHRLLRAAIAKAEE